MFINNLNNERHGELKHYLTNQYTNGTKKIYPDNIGGTMHRATSFLPYRMRHTTYIDESMTIAIHGGYGLPKSAMKILVRRMKMSQLSLKQ